ncbi:MAG: NUDIX hydrolase [Candidatus Omnitrophica bacterium]|nr:NUDIX hydrolase [Candidatus Omnitrophota bacterium]
MTTVAGYVTHIQDTLGDGPYVTVDAIIEMPQGIVVIERSNPPFGFALPGGFVDYGESLEQAVCREVKEETHLDFVDFRQLHIYSDPGRDPRFHTVSTVFVGAGKGTPASGDDAKALRVVARDDLLRLEYAFDHKQIIEDYLNGKIFHS